jgi:hypothetical protein
MRVELAYGSGIVAVDVPDGARVPRPTAGRGGTATGCELPDGPLTVATVLGDHPA